jgi:cytochrome c oxidase cbb3-type subunit I/II
MKRLGVPYSDLEVAEADRMAEQQAAQVAASLKAQGGPDGLERKEIVALVSYLQALGQTVAAKTESELSKGAKR